METNEIYDMTLKTPFNMIISGSSGSGKTQKLCKILRYRDILFNNTTSNIFFFFNEWQTAYTELKKLIPVTTFIKGIPTQEKLLDIISGDELGKYEKQPHQLLIFDDLVSEIQDDLMVKCFTVFGHHKNVSIILVTQALFNPGVNKFSVLQQNAHYLLFCKNPRDNSKIIYLAKQVSPYDINWVVKAFQDATRYPYSYIFFDFMQDTPDKLRLCSNTFSRSAPNENLCSTKSGISYTNHSI